ncbi:MAG: hypothetical protein AB8B61_05945 [Cyclobacteriaceae bacterium]
MLTKEPLGLALPLIALVANVILKREHKVFLKWEWVLIFIIPFIMLLPYLKGLYDQFGVKGLFFYFWENNAGRISGDYLNNSSDPTFYLHTLLWLFFPWSLFVVLGFIKRLKYLHNIKWVIPKKGEGASIGLISVFFVILSFAGFKSPNYLYVLSPFIAVLAAYYLAERKPSRVSKIKVVKVLTFLTVIINLTLLLVVYPKVFTYHKYRETARIINKYGNKRQVLFSYKDPEVLKTPTLKFYLKNQPLVLNEDNFSRVENNWLLISEEDSFNSGISKKD